MNEEKVDEKITLDTEAGSSDRTDQPRGNAASRARNRTVLLTPEVTGQVRAMLNEDESEDDKGFKDPLSNLLPPMAWGKE